MKYMRLGDMLIAAGAIDEEQLRQGLELQKASGERLGNALIRAGFITEQQLIEVLQMQLGVEFIDLTNVSIPVEMAQYLPKNIAKKHTVVPVKLDKNDLYVAMSDPLNFVAQEEIKQASKKQVITLISTKKATERAISILYDNEGAAKVIEEMKREASPSGAQISASNPMADEANSAPTIRFVNSLIERAILERASDIHLEPRSDEMVVRMRIDGLLRKILTVPANLQNTVTYRLKIMGGMNISERKIPQDGHAMLTLRQKELDLRINTIPTIYGEKIVIRILDKSSNRIAKQSLGLTKAELEKYDALLKNASGVILIVGPTGSGKSTTMCAMLEELSREEVNIVSLEDPVEYNIEGVNQCQINEKTGMTFATGLRAILRQDPDIISVGEIRDGETAAIATRAAITGHLVLSTLHTNDAVLAVDRLKDIGVEDYLIANSLRGVISQRLVRKICPHCAYRYTPTVQEKSMMGMNADVEVEFHRGAGCPECYHTGYRGRTAVFEVFMVSGNIQRLIQNGATYDTLIRAAMQEGHVTMGQNCVQLVLDGITTVEEAAKAINSTVQ